MTKREFVMQFVLNRAAGAATNTAGVFWVEEAIRTWNKIQEIAPEPRFPPKDPNSSAIGTAGSNV